MEMPVKSKVEEISLRPHEFLLPLFEAVVNSIVSITANNIKKGLIQISVERENSTGLFESNSFVDNNGQIIPPYIKSFTIIDNGVGFDDANFKSFSTAYSEKYKSHGCKGVGRFTILACFDSLEVESVYKNKGKQYKRNFHFNVNDEILPKDGNPNEIINEANLTKVRLNNYQDHLRNRTGLPIRTIADEIIEHCLPFFISDNTPTITIEDTLTKDKIILNDIFREVIKFDGKKEVFYPIKDGPKFEILFVKRDDARIHRLRLCANSRVVGKTVNLGTITQGFENIFSDDNGKSFCVDAYVLSEYLNSKVNTVRNSFNIPDSTEDNSLTLNEITLNSVYSEISKTLTNKYKNILEKIQEDNFQKVKAYILNPKKPQVRYRSLLGRPDLLKTIPSNISDDKIEEHLHRIKFQLEKELNKNLKKALKRVKVEDYDEYSETIKGLINQEAKFAKDKLADLVIQRKAILQLFKKMLKIGKDGSYKLESDIHNLIFPMGHTTDTLPYEYHNLWLLDERLAYHSFVASDKKLKSNPIADNGSLKEPDVLIFDFPWAFSEKDNQMSSMVIFEFKRPGRDMNTSEDKLLDSQVMKYFADLMESKAKDYKGEYINMEKTTPKFGFVVCDLHKDLVEYNTNFNQFRLTPYKTLYKLNDAINMHIEAMSYQQLVEMSERKHLAFFRELGLDDL